MNPPAVAPARSLAFALLALSASLAHAAPAPEVTVTEQALPPQEIGAPPTLPLVPYRTPTYERPFTGVDRTLAASYLVFSGLDAWQTGHLPPGYMEGNPLVSSWAGERPRFSHAVLFKAATAYGALALTSRVKHPGHRRAVLILINVVQASVVVMNERRTGGILLD